MIHLPVDQRSGTVHLFINNTRRYVSPGSSVQLAIGLTNLSSEEDVFTLWITGLPDGWAFLETPQIRLMPGEHQKITLTLRVPAGAELNSGQHPFEIWVASRNQPDDVASAEGLLLVPAYHAEGRIGVSMPAIHFTAAPGSRAAAAILVTNHGLHPDVLRLHVEGIPPAWISTSSATTRLDPGALQEIEVYIQPPRSPASAAGRHPFTLRVVSMSAPEQATEVSCVLTVTAYSAFSCSLEPADTSTGQPVRLIVRNDGNVPDTYQVTFQTQGEMLLFEPAGSQVEPAPVQNRSDYSHPHAPPTLQLDAGDTAMLEFIPRLRQPPIFSSAKAYPFLVRVEAADHSINTLQGRLWSKGIIPGWAMPAAALVLLACICSLLLALYPRNSLEASATQTSLAATAQFAGALETAAYNQTQAALAGQQDSDGDGLADGRELELGTDPANPDSDSDELLDGDEVNQRGTDPLNPDTDRDGLTDGAELLRLGTNPLDPDSDQDGLADGDETQRGSDPLNPDSDGDGLRDVDEIGLGTNPTNPDTDGDRLTDGQETPPCPDPLNPDTDGDGIIDGQDIQACDANNPSLTATAAAGLPSPTLPAASPTAPVPTDSAITPTSLPAPANSILVFESDRDGNSEIYRMSLPDQNLTRLTAEAAADTQPVWSPDGSKIAFASNRDGNYEIYIMNADGTGLVNLTNHVADDTDPAWSPDGSRIAFASNRDGNHEIYAANTDGSGLTNLTRNLAEDTQPAWFLQNTLLVLSEERIAFTSNRDGNPEIYAMQSDGSEQTNLTRHPANDHSPAGYPNASVLAFVTDRDGNQEVYLMNTDGSSPSNLSSSPAEDYQPAWLPDGEWLAFVSNRDGNAEIFMLRRDGSAIMNISRHPAGDFFPALYAR